MIQQTQSALVTSGRILFMDDVESHGDRRSQIYWKATLIFGLGLLVAVTSFGAGILTERDLINDNNSGYVSTDDGNGEHTSYNEVRQLVDEEYFGNPTDPIAATEFDETLEYSAIQGMMSSLDDYSTFLVPSEQTAVREQLSGEYQGIGVWVDFPEGKLVVISPMPGSPAEEAGILSGDVIVAVNGVVVDQTNEEDAFQMVRGPEGTTVRLTISRAGTEGTFDLDVMRRRIPVQSVIYRPIAESKLAYIQVTVFGDNTTKELDAALKQAQSNGAVGIILDLRNNGGGWVQSAQEMIGRFVPTTSGPALYEDLNPDGSERTPEPIIEGDIKLFEIPVVVLVNGGTASASEIVSGALRDYERAVIVGEQTFGKGSVQRVHDFEDGSSARITFAEWMTPDELRIQGEGIRPDIVVAMDPGNPGADPQLDKAIETLTGQPKHATPVASSAASPVS